MSEKNGPKNKEEQDEIVERVNNIRYDELGRKLINNRYEEDVYSDEEDLDCMNPPDITCGN